MVPFAMLLFVFGVASASRFASDSDMQDPSLNSHEDVAGPQSFVEEAVDEQQNTPIYHGHRGGYWHRPRNTDGGEKVKWIFSAHDSHVHREELVDMSIRFKTIHGPQKASNGVFYYNVIFDVSPPITYKRQTIGGRLKSDTCSIAVVRMRYSDFEEMWNEASNARKSFIDIERLTESLGGAANFPEKDGFQGWAKKLFGARDAEQEEERRVFFEKFVEEAFKCIGDREGACKGDQDVSDGSGGLWVVKNYNYRRDLLLHGFYTANHIYSSSDVFGLYDCIKLEE